MENKKIRVALPTNDRNYVDAHFGHAKEFAIYDIVNNKIENKLFIVSPPHAPGVIPQFLNQQGINTIITGGMGERAMNIFKENNVDVILGANGSIDDVLKQYIKGFLESKGSACSHHGDDHNCEH